MHWHASTSFHLSNMPGSQGCVTGYLANAKPGRSYEYLHAHSTQHTVPRGTPSAATTRASAASVRSLQRRSSRAAAPCAAASAARNPMLCAARRACRSAAAASAAAPRCSAAVARAPSAAASAAASRARCSAARAPASASCVPGRGRCQHDASAGHSELRWLELMPAGHRELLPHAPQAGG